MATDYLVQEVDGTSKVTLEDASGFVILETSTAGGVDRILSMSPAGSTTATFTLKRNIQLAFSAAGSTTVSLTLKRNIALSFTAACSTAASFTLFILVGAGGHLFSRHRRRRFGRH